MADFQLVDANSNSSRYQALVSPRDYMLRISAYYFGTAGCSYCRDQFRYLSTLAWELQSNQPPVSIEILGINRADQSAYTFLIPSQGNLPWLQDTVEASVWGKWGANLRDLFILDSQNRLITVTNLTNPNLALESNRAALRQLLLSRAHVTDSDGDGLSDDWESVYFRNLSHSALDDPDGDGLDNLTEYAFGTLPNQAQVHRSITLTRGKKQNQSTLFVTFRRRSGNALDYLIRTSPNLQTWEKDPALVSPSKVLRQLYDGSGTAEVTLPLPISSTPNAAAFLRIQAIAP